MCVCLCKLLFYNEVRQNNQYKPEDKNCMDRFSSTKFSDVHMILTNRVYNDMCTGKNLMSLSF